MFCIWRWNCPLVGAIQANSEKSDGFGNFFFEVTQDLQNNYISWTLIEKLSFFPNQLDMQTSQTSQNSQNNNNQQLNITTPTQVATNFSTSIPPQTISPQITPIEPIIAPNVATNNTKPSNLNTVQTNQYETRICFGPTKLALTTISFSTDMFQRNWRNWMPAQKKGYPRWTISIL